MLFLLFNKLCGQHSAALSHGVLSWVIKSALYVISEITTQHTVGPVSPWTP